MKYCIYSEFPGFLPILNPLEIKAKIKADDTVPFSVTLNEIDRYGAFLQWYEEIFNGKRDMEKGLEWTARWKKEVIQLTQEFLNEDTTDKQKDILAIRLTCLGWVAGESIMIIEQ